MQKERQEKKKGQSRWEAEAELTAKGNVTRLRKK